MQPLLPMLLQVYLGRWNEIDIAVKLLLGEAVSTSNPAAAADVLLSDSNPAQKTLQEVRSLACDLALRGQEIAARVVLYSHAHHAVA